MPVPVDIRPHRAGRGEVHAMDRVKLVRITLRPERGEVMASKAARPAVLGSR